MRVENRDTFIKTRVNAVLKKDVEEILDDLGLNMSGVINIMLSQIKLHEGLPFEIKRPNRLTQKVLEDSKQGKNTKRFKNTKDLFKDLGL